MENKTINIAVVAEVSKALMELNDQMVFIGGAVVSLYTDDPSADEIRPTGDIDLTLRVASFSDWAKLQERLARLGFSPDPQGPSICRYLYNNIAIDIMPADDSPIGVSNRWYNIGFEDLWTASAKDEQIRILSAPCFLATKFEAFNDRGKDYRTSHDFEDIIYIIDNRTTIVQEVLGAHAEIKKFLKTEVSKLLQNRFMEEIISAQIHPLISDKRYPIVLEKLREIAA
jgi:predicted nucleotidyltransferase